MPSRCAASAATSAGLLRFHAALVHVTDAAGPELHCTDALLATRRAIPTVGLADLDWIAAALTTLDERRPLPPPSDAQNVSGRPPLRLRVPVPRREGVSGRYSTASRGLRPAVLVIRTWDG
ncbi:hypothetical protein E4K73_33035 [Streptomyces sp. IB201691-2A2]|nr:hypothetical protein E4K73_33035 [Streptomyces sp. IB201691-2A2]